MDLERIIKERIDQKIDQKIEEIFAGRFGEAGPLGENAPAPQKTEKDFYDEEFELRMSRPGLTSEQLLSDARWQKFLSERPGPKMKVVYKDYLLIRQGEELSRENAELKKQIEDLQEKLKALEPGEEAPEMDESAPANVSKSADRKLGKRLALKAFLKEQKLTYSELAQLIGWRQKKSEKQVRNALTNIVCGIVAGDQKFWKALKKAFGLSTHEVNQLKKREGE